MSNKRIRMAVTGVPEVVTHKWSKPLLVEGYTPMPKRLIRCLGKVFKGKRRISTLQLVLAIADFRRPHLLRGPSIQELSFTSGLKQKTVRLLLDQIQEIGWIKTSGDSKALDIDLSGLLAKIVELTPDAPPLEEA